MKLTILDQAAIDHIASVSKNPHAAMVVKWLITGWDVVYKGQKDRLPHPCWSKDDEYELIEPKPAKPAYRVYKRNDDITTYTQDRYVSGNTSHIHNIDDVEWISDWVEYDPPKKWPTPLVERIAAIDIKAAEWIVDNWDDLLDDVYVTNDGYSRDSERLIYMFCWKNSPQGSQYWNNIDNKLND